MAASASISIDPISLQIQAGERASARVIVRNQGSTVGQYNLEVGGIESSWVRIDSQQMGIFPGDSAAAQIIFLIPVATVSATYSVMVQAANQVDPADRAQAVLNLTVQSTPLSGNPTVLSAKQPAPAAQGTVRRGTPVTAQSAANKLPARAPQAPGPTQIVLQSASATGQLQFTSDRDDLNIPPGSTMAVNLGLINSGGAAINLELSAKGPPESWLAFTPADPLTLAPGETGAVLMAISIPELAPLGFYPLTLLVQGVDDPAMTARLNLMLEIIKPGEVVIEVNPPQVEGETTGQFSVILSQTGLSPVTLSLSASDENGWLNFSFSPPAVTLPPGGKTTSRLTVGARQSLTEAESRPAPFIVTASAPGGSAAVASAQGRLVQTRPSPGTMVLQPQEQRQPAQAVFTLNITNPGISPQTFRLTASDSDGNCSYQFDVDTVNVPPGREAVTRLYVTPRQYLDGGAITHTFTVFGLPAGRSGSGLRVEGRYVQTAIQKPGLTLSPASQSSAGPAVYRVTASNPRPTPLHLELRPSDPQKLCRFAINPSGLDIPPGGQAAARLEVDPAAALLGGEAQRMCTFTVSGYATDMPNPVLVEGSLLLIHGLTWRKIMPWIIAGLIVVGLAGIGLMWFIWYNWDLIGPVLPNF